MEEKELIKLIDYTIKKIWETEIECDYKRNWLLKEDTLKNTFYFHLRKRLGDIFEENNIRIYTEFTEGKFKGSGYRPDMVIAKVDFKLVEPYQLLAVIEFKYKKGLSTSNAIYNDYRKLRTYVNKLKIDCNLYMATIWEHEDEPTSWEPEKNKWAKGILTELNASYKYGDMNFYITPHNKE